jgi:8-oxoguanine deaminase
MTMEQQAGAGIGANTGAQKRGKTMLVKHADVLVTMDGARRELRDGGLYIEDNRIVAVGPTAELPQTADEVLDMRSTRITTCIKA